MPVCPECGGNKFVTVDRVFTHYEIIGGDAFLVSKGTFSYAVFCDNEGCRALILGELAERIRVLTGR